MTSRIQSLQVLSESWFPPIYDNWILIQRVFSIAYPVMGLMQFGISWYGMGKTSVKSRLNVPGRVGWLVMEVPGFTTLLYTMYSLSERLEIESLPWQNKVLAALFTMHYLYRAIIFPLIAPSMSPLHFGILINGFAFQVCNGISLGGWLGGYGPVTDSDWSAKPAHIIFFTAGVAVFYLGLMGNFYHDEELREIRRVEQRRQQRVAQSTKTQTPVSVQKHYRVPEGLLFKKILYPHYLCEWIEWLGFWMATGFACAPARIFLVNEVFTMWPRAYNGRAWYIENFGEEKIRNKWTVIPGVC